MVAAANKAWCVLINHRLLAGREASPDLVRVRPPDSSPVRFGEASISEECGAIVPHVGICPVRSPG
jgi:hypothetical protein